MKFLAVFGNGMTERSIEANTVVEAQNKAVEIASHYAGGKWQEIVIRRIKKNGYCGKAIYIKKEHTNFWRKK